MDSNKSASKRVKSEDQFSPSRMGGLIKGQGPRTASRPIDQLCQREKGCVNVDTLVGRGLDDRDVERFQLFTIDESLDLTDTDFVCLVAFRCDEDNRFFGSYEIHEDLSNELRLLFGNSVGN